MQKKTKTIICLACLFLLVGVMGYQTIAYFTSDSTATNVITTGYVELELYEEIKANGVNWEFIPNDETMTIMPGDVVEQVAYVENTGTEAFYTRVSVEATVVDADGEELPADIISFNIDETKWVQDDDGWYRYVGIVSVGETVEADPVFTEITFSTEMDNSYIGCTVTVVVGAQAVQARYNGYTDSVLEVQGFPEIVEESEVIE